MKKIMIAALVLALCLSASPAAAQTPAYPTELTYLDAQVNLLLPRLAQFQAQYYVVNGRYYQALVSHASPPTVPVVPDQISASPTDQPETLAYFWDYSFLPDTLAWSFRIDTYNAPAGEGYVLTVETTVNAETWRRAINYGPEDWRAADWYVVTHAY